MEPVAAADWLRLLRAEIPFRRKLEIVENTRPEDVRLLAGDRLLQPGERRRLEDPALAKRVDEDLRFLDEGRCNLVTLASPDYPARLKEISRPPLMLFVIGAPEVLSAPLLAIVGSRNPSPQGLETAREFASMLADSGFGIASGLALGIDGAAHGGCLDARGLTVAVVATGPDRVYPAAHAPLAERIEAFGGAVVTEFPPGEPPRAKNFPRRNRIISGLAVGTLVVEAGLRSGSLITARYALEQNRDVFAIPGSIHNPLARGCHHLIRQGAKLVEQVGDVLEEYRLPAPAKRARQCEGPPPGGIAHRVFESLGHGPTDFDQVVLRTALSAQEVATALAELELRGLVCKSAGFFSRCGA